MIYNRTYIDIINARKIYYNKVQKFIPLTEQEQEIVDKAFFNLKAINRITNKISEIWELVVSIGGEKVQSEDVRQWTEQEIFTFSDFSHIRENIGEIISQLENVIFIDVATYQNMYDALNDEYVYTNLNNVERLLFDIYSILDGFVVQIENQLYIIGAYSVSLSEGVLTIE